MGDRQLEGSHVNVWAEQVVRFVADQTTSLELDRDAVAAVFWQMREMCLSMAANHPSLGKHDEARRGARLFGAMAAAAVRARPRRVEPYLLVCEAHLQVAKNALRTGDHATVERAIRQSLEAALKAQDVDPNSEEARRFVVERRRRFAGLESRRK